jgi:hypothetical protein
MNDNVKNNNTKNTKASAMIYALVFLYITSLIAIGLINLFESQLKLASSKIRLEQRYELLNTGLDIAMSFLANISNNSTPTIDDLKDFNHNSYNIKNYNLQVYIFDKKTIEKTLADKTIKAIENEIRQNGVRNLENKLGSINGNNIAELPYLIVSKASASKRNNTYQIALVNLEYFCRYAYFTNFEEPPDGGVIWFGIGSDFFNGPVRTNDKFVFWTFKTSGGSSFYDNNNFVKPTFKGKFIFTGANKFLSNLRWQDNEINSEKEVNSDGGIFISLNNSANTPPDTEEKLSQIIEGGSINLVANAKKIDLNSNLTSEDNIKNKIWPDFSSNPPNLDKMGVFIKTDYSSNINSALLINPEDDGDDNKIYSLNLEVNQGVQAYKIKFKKDEPEKEITIYKVNNNNFNVSTDGLTNPNFKVKVINNLEPNKVINLLSYFEDEDGFQDQGSNYSVNQKALVLTRVKDGNKEVVVINLNDKSFPKNVIWVNGSIGDKLNENNKEGGLIGVYNEPLTIMAKPAKTSDQVNPNDFYDIRINGNIVPYRLNIDPNFRIPELTKDDKSIMGLYADRIFIGSNAKNNLLRDTNGKEHIYIYSSIMAIKSRDRNNIDGHFEVENHGRSDVWGNFYFNRRYLHIYGGLTQCYRGFVLTFDYNAFCMVGFQKDYNYDNRLAYMNPPYFPSTGEYIILFKKILTNY